MCSLLLSWAMYAQVGIGTTNPQADLEIAGSTLVQKELKTGSLPAVNNIDEDFKLVTRVTNSSPVGEITKLDVDALTVAPINVIEYTFRNFDGDNLTDLDLGLDATKYIVGVANFRYIGSPVAKILTSGRDSVGTFVVRAFQSGGTWHLEIRNRFLEVIPDGAITYRATLIIYDTSFYKRLDPIVTDLGGSNRGTASEIPVLQ